MEYLTSKGWEWHVGKKVLGKFDWEELGFSECAAKKHKDYWV